MEQCEVGLLVLDEFVREGGLPQQEELGEKSRFVEPDTLPSENLKKRFNFMKALRYFSTLKVRVAH